MVVVALGDRADNDATLACGEASEQHHIPHAVGEALLQSIQDFHELLGAYHKDMLERLDTIEERLDDPKFWFGGRRTSRSSADQGATDGGGDGSVGQQPASPSKPEAARSMTSLLYPTRDPSNSTGTRESAIRKSEALEAEEESKHTQNSFKKRKSRSQTRIGKIVASPKFEYFFAIAIFLSSILQGIEVEYASRALGQPTPLPFTILQYICNLLFVIELVMRLQASGCRNFYVVHKHWAVLDTFAVIVSIVEVAADIVVLVLASRSEVSWSASNLRTLRMVRITRLVRAVRIQRIIRFVSSLRILVDSIVATLRSLVWAMVLLTLIIYVCAVTFTQAAADYQSTEEHENDMVAAVHNYWGNLYASMGTLFQAISGGESWRNGLLPLEAISPVLGLCLYVYIAFTYFAVLNVVTGVFCKSAIDTTQCNPEIVAQAMRATRDEQERQLKTLFFSLDKNHNGQITMGNLERLMHDPITQGYFSVLGLNVNDAWTLFKLLDTDGGGTIEVDEFLEGLAQLQGNARNLDVATIKYDLRLLATRVVYFISQMERRFALSAPE